MSLAELCKNKKLLFVTGKLAQSAVRDVVESFASKYDFKFDIQVLPITVAALMTGKWIVRHLSVAEDIDVVVIPGFLHDDLAAVQSVTTAHVIVGPKDIRDLGALFGEAIKPSDYGDHQIEIIAEINYAGRLSIPSLIDQAVRLKQDGADIIDLGCDPGQRWQDVASAVNALREKEIRCSIDTFDTWEVSQAVQAGAELVLSVNEANVIAARDWNAEVVVIPTPGEDWLQSIQRTIERLESFGCAYRIDPILDPIGCGFWDSLMRYKAVREKFPDAKMMMGIGNITELTDVDSAGVNMMLLAICEELRVTSILTTQVINWARSSVAECNVARRLVHFAQKHSLPPKRIDPRLVMLRDPRLKHYSLQTIEGLAESIRDNNYRIIVDASEIHIISAGVHIRGRDPFLMMDQLMSLPQSSNVDASHAFYLGFELSKAATALQLGKQYEQDVALNWGMLTVEEQHHRLRRGRHHK